MDNASPALRAWADQLAAWAIPEHILAAAEESPWVLPRDVLARRAEQHAAAPGGPSYDATVDALHPPGTLLDVGAGGGATSLPVLTHHRDAVTALTAVDVDDDLLGRYARRAAELGVPCRTVTGRWPAVAAEVPAADVVVCGHVLYNVPDLAPFVRALTGHAYRRVVVEITFRHPLAALNPLWQRFHGITRPEGPTLDDALAVLNDLRIAPRVTRWTRPATAHGGNGAEQVDVVRRRLCLPAARAGEVAAALDELDMTDGAPPDLGSSGRDLATLVWDGAAAPAS